MEKVLGNVEVCSVAMKFGQNEILESNAEIKNDLKRVNGRLRT
jgi:hypothetical protein